MNKSKNKKLKEIKIKTKKAPKNYLLAELVGMKYALPYLPSLKRAIALMYTGCPVTLKHEPENEYDKNALAVYLEKTKIGYISKKHNKKLLQVAKRKKSISSVVASDTILHHISLDDFGNQILCVW